MPQAGDPIAADHVNWAATKWYEVEATGSLGASQSGILVPGCTINFTTETANATMLAWYVLRADPTASSATAVMSGRAVVTAGPGSFNQGASAYAVAAWNAGAAGDLMTTGNQTKITLGAAGTYTVQLLATTGANESIGVYSSLMIAVQEVLP